MLPTTETGALEGHKVTGSPGLWGKGRVRDKGLTLSVSTDVTEEVQNLK